MRDQSTPPRSAQLLDRLVTSFANDYGFATFHALPPSLLSRFGYLPRKYAAILQNRREVRFLGRPFATTIASCLPCCRHILVRLPRWIDTCGSPPPHA